MNTPVHFQTEGSIGRITLNDPKRRNAMGLAMFDAMEASLDRLRTEDAVHVVMVCGEGPAFCAGFDLIAAADNPDLIRQYIERLSGINRLLRRLPQIVVAAVHGPAIAGGCALLSACDFMVVAPGAMLGYPVHRLGVSPAVTIPTLTQAVGPGAARELLMSGELIDGRAALELGLATDLAESDELAFVEAERLCESLACKGPHALRVTKQWLNELDGSRDDETFDRCARASALLASGTEAEKMLRLWMKHTSERQQHKRAK
jgi:methylglutaconyl-CoA hydratase